MSAPLVAVPIPAPVLDPKPAEEQEWFEKRAVELGADELMDRATWVLRDDPKAILRLSRRYISFCMDALSEMGESARKRIKTPADTQREEILAAISRAGDEGVPLQRLCEVANASIEDTLKRIRQINSSEVFVRQDASLELVFDGDSGVVWVVP